MKAQLWQGAFVELNKATEIKPDLLSAQLDLGNLYLAAKKTEDARKKANLILQRSPRTAVPTRCWPISQRPRATRTKRWSRCRRRSMLIPRTLAFTSISGS